MDTDHDSANWEEIDAVRLLDASATAATAGELGETAAGFSADAGDIAA